MRESRAVDDLADSLGDDSAVSGGHDSAEDADPDSGEEDADQTELNAFDGATLDDVGDAIAGLCKDGRFDDALALGRQFSAHTATNFGAESSEFRSALAILAALHTSLGNEKQGQKLLETAELLGEGVEVAAVAEMVNEEADLADLEDEVAALESSAVADAEAALAAREQLSPEERAAKILAGADLAGIPGGDSQEESGPESGASESGGSESESLDEPAMIQELTLQVGALMELGKHDEAGEVLHQVEEELADRPLSEMARAAFHTLWGSLLHDIGEEDEAQALYAEAFDMLKGKEDRVSSDSDSGAASAPQESVGSGSNMGEDADAVDYKEGIDDLAQQQVFTIGQVREALAAEKRDPAISDRPTSSPLDATGAADRAKVATPPAGRSTGRPNPQMERSARTPPALLGASLSPLLSRTDAVQSSPASRATGLPLGGSLRSARAQEALPRAWPTPREPAAAQAKAEPLQSPPSPSGTPGREEEASNAGAGTPGIAPAGKATGGGAAAAKAALAPISGSGRPGARPFLPAGSAAGPAFGKAAGKALAKAAAKAPAKHAAAKTAAKAVAKPAPKAKSLKASAVSSADAAPAAFAGDDATGEVIDSDARDADAERREDPIERATAARDFLKSLPMPQRVSATRQGAVHALGAGNVEAAADSLEELLSDLEAAPEAGSPEHINCFEEYSAVLELARDWEGAVDALSAARELCTDPVRSADLTRRVGKVFAHATAWTQARAELADAQKRYLALGREKEAAQTVLEEARVCVAQENLEQAEELYQRAIASGFFNGVDAP